MTPIDASLPAAMSPWEPGGMALTVFALVVGAVVLVLLALTRFVNPARTTPEKDRPYECGVIPTAGHGFRYPAPFALVAMAFLVFDVETAFIYAWAVSFEKLTPGSFLGICVFIGVLLGSLWYLWQKGGLQWGAPIRK